MGVEIESPYHSSFLGYNNDIELSHCQSFFAFLTISTNIMSRQIALLAMSGEFLVRMPLTIQQRLPSDTRYLTISACLASIPMLRKMVAIHPIISAIIILTFLTCHNDFADVSKIAYNAL